MSKYNHAQIRVLAGLIHGFRLGDRTARTVFVQLGPEPDRRSADHGGDILCGVIDCGFGRAFVEVLNANVLDALLLLDDEAIDRISAGVAQRRGAGAKAAAEDVAVAAASVDQWAPAPPATQAPPRRGAPTLHDLDRYAAAYDTERADPVKVIDLMAQRAWIVHEQIIYSDGRVDSPPPPGFEPFAVTTAAVGERRVYWRGPA